MKNTLFNEAVGKFTAVFKIFGLTNPCIEAFCYVFFSNDGCQELIYSLVSDGGRTLVLYFWDN